ncbi:uncharacterized protein LOC131008402 [Salvia miltiorrhiza]|uniref:uncharacterized protein LOC131008402 n=1 Tax=Salvia miltiorrhiza TaxID=226208 RepID=UPI0025AC95E3|nr:uncharacterized protein LOC131008402 [Salvia miltiorrhiza]
MRRKDLATEERSSILQFLLLECKNGKSPSGKMKAMEEKFHVCRRTISHIWFEAKQQQDQGQCISSTGKKICRPRRKRVHIDLELIASLEIKRSTIRRLANGINCSKSTVGRWIDQRLIKSRTNAIKPDLAAPNKLLRMRFCLEAMEYDRLQHAIVAQDGSVLFDGKIGIFPFTEMVAAKRSSKNRVAGTLEQKLIPAIKAKWPSFYSKDIYIQQDNARPHIKNEDIDFREVASSDGFNINIVHQPPNSPNTNINDLGCLQGCMLEILKVKGQNYYKLPHMKKGSLIRQEMMPLCLEVPQQLVSGSIAYLKEKGEVEGIEDLMQRLGVHEAIIDGIESQFNALMLLD